MSQNDLKSLYETIYPPEKSANGQLIKEKNRMEHLQELADGLSKIAGKNPPWSARYINSIILEHKGFSINDELRRAINIYGARRFDEVHPLKAQMVTIEYVLSVNGNLKPGDFISGHRRQCACLVWFVPHSNLQRYCCPECPARPKKKVTN